MKRFFALTAAAALLAFCCACTQAPAYHLEPDISQMKAICELATMKCYYHTVAKYKEENAEQFLWMSKDKKFWVEYSGIVRLGVDISRMDIAVNGTDVTITLPDAEVLDCRVDPDSLNEDSFIVDKDSADITADDQTKAFDEAQAQLEEYASQDTLLLAEAKQRAQTLLEDYITNIGTAMGTEYHITWLNADSSAAPESDGAAADPASGQTECQSSGTTGTTDTTAPEA